MRNVGIKFKEFIYIYKFKCFELIWMDLKSYEKCKNKKNFSIFCIRLISMQNCKSRIQWIGQILFVSTFAQYKSPFPLDLKINMDRFIKVMGNVGIKFKEFVYIYNFTCFELIWMDLKSHGKGRNQKNFSIFCIKLTLVQNCKSRIQ